jgi:LPS sulfotransferase NodH
MKVEVDRTYALVGSPHAGINWLCQLLRDSGVLGAPGEYFEDDQLRSSRKYSKNAANLVWQRALGLGQSANGICAIKIFPDLLKYWPSANFVSFLSRCKLVQLRRKDLLNLAISWSIGFQTGGSATFKNTHGRTAKYHAQLIEQRFATIVADNLAWDLAVERWGNQTITLCSEDILEEPLEALNRLARLMGVPPLTSLATEGDYRIQRGSTNAEFKARFISEQSGMVSIIEGATQ